MPPARQNRVSTPPASAAKPDSVRGFNTWLAVVRTYQKCSEVLTEGVKPLGLKLAQHDVMMRLLIAQQQTQQQLAGSSFVTKSHMSAVLTEMAEQGWIERTESPTDKRSKVVRLTSAGHHLALQAHAVQAAVVGAMMAPLSDRQMGELERMSRNAVSALDAL
jgi:DNA-binding MarR family transcriptional regulator